MPKPKLLTLISSLFAFLLLIFLVPPFIFNEFEYHIRKEMGNGLMKDAIAKQMVELRVWLNQSEEHSVEAMKLGEEVEKVLGESVGHFELAEQHAQKQALVLFFTSPKYREYSQMQQAAIADLVENERYFLALKQQQHKTTNVLIDYRTFRDKLMNVGEPEIWWGTIDDVEPFSHALRAELTAMQSAGTITPELYAYITTDLELFAFMRQQALKVEASGSWDDFDQGEFLQRISSNPGNPNQLITQISDQWQTMQNTYWEQFWEIDQQLYQMGNYYRDEKLAEDTLTRMLSRVWSTYPRVKVQEPTDPTTAPADTTAEELSMGYTLNRSI